MVKDERRNNSVLPWVEASTALGVVLIAAIATSAVSLYRIDEIDNKLDTVTEKVEKINIIQHEIQMLKDHDKQTQIIFEKIATSVDRLAIAVAKLEVKANGKER